MKENPLAFAILGMIAISELALAKGSPGTHRAGHTVADARLGEGSASGAGADMRFALKRL